MPQEVRCTQCNMMLFKAEGSKIVMQNKGHGYSFFEVLGSLTTRCKCSQINVFVPQPVKRRLAIAG